MICRTENDTVLFAGTVSKIKFSPMKDRVSVEFAEHGNFEFEYCNNGKNARADHVRKSRFKVGEKLLAIGGQKTNADLSAYGYDLMRSGKVEQGSHMMISGKITGIIKMCENKVLTVIDENNRTYYVSASASMASKLEIGMNVAIECKVVKQSRCIGVDENGNFCHEKTKDCWKTCSKVPPKKKYIATDIMKI